MSRSFKDVFRGRERGQFGGGNQAYMSGLELGSPEQPPHGVLRHLWFGCRQLGRRCVGNAKAEWPLLLPRLWVIIPLLIFQYVHAIFTGMAYYMHTPLPVDNTTLHDLGFEALPYLSVDAVSEVLVYCGFGMFFVWLLSPFVTRRKSFHAAVVLKRVLVILVVCQIFRILSFLSTQLPAPAPHCRAPEPTSDVPWPVWWKVIIVNVSRQASKGCGDLIFSSHLTFILTFTWTYAVMGQFLLLKAAAFLYAAATALCIIASRKHYTVDVTVAAYVVPLVFFHFCRRWATQRDDICTADNRGVISLASPALPVTAHQAGAGGDSSSKHGGMANGSSTGADVHRTGGSAHIAAAAGPAGGELRIDVEMAGRQGSAPLVLESQQQPDSPVKRAWSTLADLPRRMAGSRPGSGAAHRRTESQEPVLPSEDMSSGSL